MSKKRVQDAVTSDVEEIVDEVREEAKELAKATIKEWLFGKEDDEEDKGFVGEHKKKLIGVLAAGAVGVGLSVSVSVSNTDNSVNTVGGDQIKNTTMVTNTETKQVTDNSVNNSTDNSIDNSKVINTGDINNAKTVNF